MRKLFTLSIKFMKYKTMRLEFTLAKTGEQLFSSESTKIGKI